MINLKIYLKKIKFGNSSSLFQWNLYTKHIVKPIVILQHLLSWEPIFKISLLNLINTEPTTIHKIFETNCGFHVK